MQIDAKGIGFRYENSPWLFQGVNLTIQPGEIIGITGPSGCGKTTFCRIVAGYEEPTEGMITFGEKPLQKSGYQPIQLILQHPEKAVNPRWKMRKTLNEAWEPDQELLDLFGIRKDWLDRWPNELSGGELQRFCVARALGPNTRFLIADEMTTMLDSITQAQIWHAVLSIAEKRNMGIVVVSHEAKLVQRICHREIQFSHFSV
ncbi:ABC transporter ATP-binding protein [Litchfieldia salsa]|uniref:Peptide/nickel transport system ATP-binding protein n=1 Tax=Litchfieldia salsa TaxID=930152 RepID=A0A1H0PTE8_9BACI|nr:ATP-binding cassette domain-containing protein [Litchfieldia salsa]SDP08422.1 peptide/nickel transport system ATP-binding protein [Litchfieldia salsa]